jgi:hypothetical protein
MSKHYFTRSTPQGVFEVHMGWDNPLNEYFCNIFLVSESDQESNVPLSPEWSSLYDSDLLTPNKIKAKCKEYDIDLPSGLINAVINDRFHYVKNKIVNWDE